MRFWPHWYDLTRPDSKGLAQFWTHRAIDAAIVLSLTIVDVPAGSEILGLDARPDTRPGAQVLALQIEGTEDGSGLDPNFPVPISDLSKLRIYTDQMCTMRVKLSLKEPQGDVQTVQFLAEPVLHYWIRPDLRNPPEMPPFCQSYWRLPSDKRPATSSYSLDQQIEIFICEELYFQGPIGDSSTLAENGAALIPAIKDRWKTAENEETRWALCQALSSLVFNRGVRTGPKWTGEVVSTFESFLGGFDNPSGWEKESCERSFEMFKNEVGH
ncbi:MAG: hypothetical protein WAO20_16520 [Acidobacteriota bacterium]